MQRFQRACIWSTVGLFAVALVGCGEPAVPAGTVTGKVTVKGKPYTDGQVMFFSQDLGRGSNAVIDETGTFVTTIPMPVGSYAVYLDKKPAPVGEMEIAKPGPPPGIPVQYAGYHTSPLKTDVVEGENHFDVVVP